MALETYELPSSQTSLANLPVGTIDLGVPLVGNIIQVGIEQQEMLTLPRTTVVVCTDPDKIVHITRKDGKPLEAELVVRTEYEDSPPQRISIFAKPIGALLVNPTMTDRGVVWTASADAGTKPYLLDDFVEAIGFFGLEKIKPKNTTRKSAA